MGSLFSRTPSESDLKDAYIDFENAKPNTEDEEAVYNDIQIVLGQAAAMVQDIKEYQGADMFIRSAISSPSPETENAAWDAICPIVLKLKSYYDYSNKLNQAVPPIVAELAKSPIGEHGYPELSECMVKQFCDVVSFAFEFDGYKIRNPSIQNDFAYYKRRMARTGGKESELPVNHELAAHISMFYATATPMLTGICNSVQELFKKSDLKVAQTLETMIEVTIRMLENVETSSKLQSPEDTLKFILRVMTGLIIIYDHVHDQGAFSKKTPVDIRAAIAVLQNANEDVLLDAIRYSTKHINDDSTPAKIKQMLA